MLNLSADTSRFTFSAADLDFLVVEFKAEEKISQLYQIDLILASEEDIDIKAILGKTGLLTFYSEDEDRFFHGIVRRFGPTGQQGRFFTYKAALAPQAVLLEHCSDCRVFQHRRVPQIVSQVLEEAGVTADLFEFRLQDNYSPRDYCVQYRETDLDFICRVLAEEGIFFFFEHSPNAHRMIFGDSTACYQSIAGSPQIPWNPGAGLVAEKEAVTVFGRSQSIHTGRYAQRDFNFEKPDLDLTTKAQANDNHELTRFDFPGDYALPEQGRRLTRVRLEQAVSDKDLAEGQSTVARFIPGGTFTLTEASNNSLDGTFVLTRLRHRGRQPQVLAEHAHSGKAAGYHNEFNAVPAGTIVRPDPARHPKPLVNGPQTAIVTGPAGEEIYTDRHGRIKVQFHWDRYGSSDEHSSCWMRVSQGWAGPGWGAVHIPRIGQEVLVDFLEGDPDRPIITGRVYNAANMPPYELPEHKTRSTIKSNTTPGSGGFNELRFEDKKDGEEIYLHGQKDWTIAIENDKNQTIGHDETLDVANNREKHVGVNQSESIGADKTIAVGVNHNESIGANQNISVGANRIVTVSGAKTETVTLASAENIGGAKALNIGAGYAVTVAGAMNTAVGLAKLEEIGLTHKLLVGQNLEINVGRNIEIICGKSRISLDKDGNITISGANFTVTTTDHMDLNSDTIDLN